MDCTGCKKIAVTFDIRKGFLLENGIPESYIHSERRCKRSIYLPKCIVPSLPPNAHERLVYAMLKQNANVDLSAQTPPLLLIVAAFDHAKANSTPWPSPSGLFSFHPHPAHHHLLHRHLLPRHRLHRLRDNHRDLPRRIP